MPSSISNSEPSLLDQPSVRKQSFVRYIRLFFALAILGLAAGEVIIRIGFSNISQIESRIRRDSLAAAAVRHATPPSASVLLLGNSLLLEGLDYDLISKHPPTDVLPTRFAVEQTEYIDWFYGMRRLFAEGARPDHVVLCLNVHQLISDSTLGDYSAFRLFRAADLISIGQRTHMDATSVSSLYFSHFSLFYAGRANVRNFMMNKLFPQYGTVFHQSLDTPAKRLDEAEVVRIGASRLTEFRELCRQYNADLEFLLPPGFETESAALNEAGKKAGVPILIPVSQNSWKRDMFRDGYHVNRVGSTEFTKRLVVELKGIVK